MTYCRCYSCKCLLRYELKTECGQIFANFFGMTWVHIKIHKKFIIYSFSFRFSGNVADMYHVLTFVEIWIKNNVDKFLRFFNWCCWVNRNGTKLTDSPKITKIILFTVKSHHPRLDWLKKWMDSKILKWIISQFLFCLFYSSLLFVVLSSHINKVLY